MRTLVIVHLEPYFQTATGVDLQQLAKSVRRICGQYNRVINITSARAISDGLQFEELSDLEEKEWIWGFDYEYHTEEEPDRWQEGVNWIKTTGHEASEILDWMNDLDNKAYYTLVVGCRSECLQDIYDIFVHLNLRVKIKETLTY